MEFHEVKSEHEQETPSRACGGRPDDMDRRGVSRACGLRRFSAFTAQGEGNVPLAVPLLLKTVLKFNQPLGQAAAEYYTHVFHASEIQRFAQIKLHGLESYNLLTVEMEIGGATFQIQETDPLEFIEYPPNLHVGLELNTTNIDAMVHRIDEWGGLIIRWEIKLNQHLLKLEDPFGYVWLISSP